MDGDLLRQEAAHAAAALHALREPSTAEHALLMTALQRLHGLGQDLKIEVAPLLEYAAQVLPAARQSQRQYVSQVTILDTSSTLLMAVQLDSVVGV